MLLANKTCPPIHQLNSKNDDAVLSLKTVELFPGVCCCGWQGWTWIETSKSWPNVFKFEYFAYKNHQKGIVVTAP